MKITTQNRLFKHLLEATEIDNIQCRYIAFKLSENNVKTIISIERIEPLKYSLKTDNGRYKMFLSLCFFLIEWLNLKVY